MTKRRNEGELLSDSLPESSEAPPNSGAAVLEASPAATSEEATKYVVAAGLFITSKRGILHAGDAIAERDVGSDSFASLIESGAVAKVG